VKQLKRQLGLRQAVAVGVGGTIGGGIFVLVGAAAGVAGPAVLLSFVLAFVASLLIALPYAELSSRFPLAGGGYAFAKAVFDRGWAFLLGWAYWGAYVFISGYVTLGFGGYLQLLTGIPGLVGAEILIALVTTMNLIGLRVSGKAQATLVAGSVVVLAGFAVTGLSHVEAQNFSPFFPSASGGVLAAALLAFLAFGGFDMVASAGEEVTRPERNLPLAILLTLALVLGLYLVVAYVAVGTVPLARLGASSVPLSEAAAAIFGPELGQRLVGMAAILTTAATANAVLIVTSRVTFAMSRDGMLPSALSAIRASSTAPWASVLLNGFLIALVPLLGSVVLVATIGGFLYVLHFMFPIAAVVVLRRRERKARPSRSSFRVPAGSIVLPLSFVACAILIVASGFIGIAVGSFWLGLGVVLWWSGLLGGRLKNREAGGNEVFPRHAEGPVNERPQTGEETDQKQKVN